MKITTDHDEVLEVADAFHEGLLHVDVDDGCECLLLFFPREQVEQLAQHLREVLA